MQQAALPLAPALLTVGQLARRIQGAVERGFADLWVVGEISNFKVAPSGHCYFTLKDPDAQIAAVLFRSDCARLRFRPSDGLEVVARGRVTFFGPRGSLQLAVQSLEPRGLGALRAQLDRLRNKLADEGLLDPARRRPLPFLPRVIGIVTALRGAALQDMLTVIAARFPDRRIVVRPVRVQGMGAEQEITAGIRDLQAIADLDVMIVGRGGGSIEDLWAFNDEGLARAIVACRVPVISAVGHEIDVTIADLVADHRAPTPTAAAERVVPRKADLAAAIEERRRVLALALRTRLALERRRVEALRARLRHPRRDLALGRSRAAEARGRLLRALARRLDESRSIVRALDERLRLVSPARAVAERRGALDHAERAIVSCARHRVEIARERASRLSASLSGLSPLAVLERGYGVVWKSGDRRALRSAGDVAPGDRLEIRLARGALAARVESVEARSIDTPPKP